MLFTQLEFIFVFLPAAVAGYLAASNFFETSTPRLIWLLAASLTFYGYWDWHFLPVIVISISINYLLARSIASLQASAERTIVFALAIAANIVALGFYKYVNFGIELTNAITGGRHHSIDVVLPLGISFFSFTQIAYICDVYRDHRAELSPIKYALFVSYFPHLIAGPILHHREMMPQFDSSAARTMSSKRAAIGITVFTIGLFKKIIVADSLALIANPVFNSAEANLNAIDAWCGALAYSLQIYFDFSGYSDMAIGLSLIFGIKLPFNFDSPYKSRSIIEFWRRWHITLSRFLRDYLYIPLGGNKAGPYRRYLNILITMFLGGLWHGAGLTFVFWGVLHGIFLIVNHVWRQFVSHRPLLAGLSRAPAYAGLSLIITQSSVVVAWVLFRSDNLTSAIRILRSMSSFSDFWNPSSDPIVTPIGIVAIAIGYISCIVMPNVNSMFDREKIGIETYHNEQMLNDSKLKWRPSVLWALSTSAMFVVAVVFSFASGARSPFLYFQF